VDRCRQSEKRRRLECSADSGKAYRNGIRCRGFKDSRVRDSSEKDKELKRLIGVDHIICGDYVLPMDESLSVIEKGAVAISGNKVVETGTSREIFQKYISENIVKGDGRVVLPGLINTHTHAAMVYFRGIADDLPLTDWLNKHIWPAENKWLSPEFIADAVELACLEMLKGGVTTYSDMYFFEDAAGVACKRIGMRAVLGSGILDFPSVSAKSTDEYIENAERFAQNWKDDDLIKPCIAPHALYTCSPETLKKSKAKAEKLNLPLHIHLSETEWEVREVMTRYNKRPVKHLADIGFIDESVIAHTVPGLTTWKLNCLRSTERVSLLYRDNLKLASGFAPVVPYSEE
jgi:5-methylthioadenosine/S-adenosylhomocysteine deaminase